MTLDEAIRHAEEVAEEQEKLYRLCPVTDHGCKGDKYCNLMNHEYDGCLKCAEEHRQLAEWLKDYKRLLEQAELVDGDRAISLKAVLDICGCSEVDFWSGEMHKKIEKLPPVTLYEDAISRQAVLEKAFKLKFKDMQYMTTTEEFVNVKDIKQLPPVTPQQPTGQWIWIDDEKYSNFPYYGCSICHGEAGFLKESQEVIFSDYCPNCGVKMVELQNLKYADNETMMPAT